MTSTRTSGYMPPASPSPAGASGERGHFSPGRGSVQTLAQRIVADDEREPLSRPARGTPPTGISDEPDKVASGGCFGVSLSSLFGCGKSSLPEPAPQRPSHTAPASTEEMLLSRIRPFQPAHGPVETAASGQSKLTTAAEPPALYLFKQSNNLAVNEALVNTEAALHEYMENGMYEPVSETRVPDVTKLVAKQMDDSGLSDEERKDFLEILSKTEEKKVGGQFLGVDRAHMSQITPLLKDSASAIDQANKAKPALDEALGGCKAFDDFPRDQMWRFVIDGDQQKDPYSMYAFENEPGYLAAGYEGLTEMINGLGKDLSLDSLEELNKKTRVKNESSELAEKQQGLFDGGVTYSIKPGKNATQEGLIETFDSRHEGAVSKLMARPDTKNMEGQIHGKRVNDEFLVDVTVDELRGMSKSEFDKAELKVVRPPEKEGAEELAASVNTMLSNYNENINNATSTDEKLEAIAGFCRSLAVEHPFQDGNARTGGLVLNKLLLENQLQPALMEDINVIGGCSKAEIVAEIKKGQASFDEQCRR